MTVWERRDLPVLRALADTDDENILQGHLHLSADDESPLGLDLTTAEIYDAVLTLSDAGYVEGELQHEGGRSVLLSRFQITGRGYQALVSGRCSTSLHHLRRSPCSWSASRRRHPPARRRATSGGRPATSGDSRSRPSGLRRSVL
jgi:hypothetical protein